MTFVPSILIHSSKKLSLTFQSNLKLNNMTTYFLIALVFFFEARRRGVHPWLWAAIGAVAYFIGEFTLGFIIGIAGLFNIMMEKTPLLFMSLAIVSGIATTLVAYKMMKKQSKKKKQLNNGNVIDDTFNDK